jgi:hypothetical protein
MFWRNLVGGIVLCDFRRPLFLVKLGWVYNLIRSSLVIIAGRRKHPAEIQSFTGWLPPATFWQSTSKTPHHKEDLEQFGCGLVASAVAFAGRDAHRHHPAAQGTGLLRSGWGSPVQTWRFNDFSQIISKQDRLKHVKTIGP